MNAQKKKKMIEAIEKNGCLLVYPIKNAKTPKSLWYELYPRTEMVWEWGEDGDSRVAELWHSREVLSRSQEVVYAKWYQARATFFSINVYTNLLAFLGTSRHEASLPKSSQEALDSLLIDSPQSTKLLKENLGLQGRLLESHYNKALKPLWEKLYIVGFGETEDSSFPSLNMAASETLFEECWLKSQKINPMVARQELERTLGSDNPFMKFADKVFHKKMKPN